MSDGDFDVPVLIAGGGMIGLSTAMFLAQHGIRSIAVERMRHGSPLPRAGHFHLRTIELFRSAGIEDEVRQGSERDFVPEGAIVAMDSLAGKKLADIIPGLNVGVDDTLTPVRRMFINQPSLERILRKRADEVGATVRPGWELIDVKQDDSGVTATVKDVDTAQEERIRARYLVGADGAHSKVRDLLGIPMDGRGIFSHSMTIYFHADCWPWVGDKPLSVIYINNPVFGGFFRFARDCQSGFMAVNTVGDPKADPVKAANAAADVSEPKLIEYIRAGVGVPDLPVTIDGCTRWRATSDVARKFQDGRVFLVGDAAHLMPPNGGFGGNTGFQDAHNLAWKIAMVLNGVAAPALLASYEAERKPVAKFTVEQAYTRYVTRTATYLGKTDYQPFANDFNIELGYVYHSPAVISEGGETVDHGDPRNIPGLPGSRAPHVWVEKDGKRLSVLDLFGASFVLLAGPDGAVWQEAGRAASSRYKGLQLDVHVVGGPSLGDPEGRFVTSYGISPSGASLVRPDGVVAWRAAAPPTDPAGELARALGAVLGKA
jgi:2-polyprenyl-6-methoxyphenol hydroxylase-like FAD-dependent oxidoreductase